MSEHDDVPPGLRKAFAAAREAEPSRERALAIATKLGAALDRPIAQPSAAAGAPRWSARIGVGVVVLGMVGAGAVWWMTRSPEAASEQQRVPTVETAPSRDDTLGPRRESRVSESAPAASAEQAKSASPTREARSRPPRAREAAAPRVTPSPTPPVVPEVAIPSIDPSESIVAEDALVGSAQRALRTSPARALALATEHERRYPSGALAQERELIAVEALVSVGRVEQARARGRAFLARWPGSAHAPRIRTIVAQEDSP